MPNWCYTEMHVEGSKERLDEFLEFMAEYDKNNKPINDFSFQKVIPRPKSLDITAGSVGNVGYAAFYSKHDNDWKTILSNPWAVDEGLTTREELQEYLRKTRPEAEEEGKKYDYNLKTYGYRHWYDWNRAHWGTKWDACSARIERENDERVFITFETAWLFPEPIFYKLFELFPDLRFTGIIDEEGGFFYGELTGNAVNFYDGVRPSNKYREEEDE